MKTGFQIVIATAVVSLLLLLSSCGTKKASTATPIQQQTVGEVTVTLLNDNGHVKLGPNVLTLEFRNSQDNQLVDPGSVQISASMPMPGMSPMTAGATVKPAGTTGRFEVAADFGMRGKWNFTVNFSGDRQASFAINAE